MVAMSTPSTLSQACRAWPVSASGRPEAKPSTVTTSRRCSGAPARGCRGSAHAACWHAPHSEGSGPPVERAGADAGRAWLLLVDRLGQRQQPLARQRRRRARSRSGRSLAFDPVEQAELALALVAERGRRAVLGLAQVDGDALAAAAVSGTSAARSARRHRAAAGRRPARSRASRRSNSFTGTSSRLVSQRARCSPARCCAASPRHADLDRMAHLGHVDRVRHRGALRPASAPARTAGCARRCGAARRAHAAADQEQPAPRRPQRCQAAIGAAAPPRRCTHGCDSRSGTGSSSTGVEPRAQRVAVGRPQAHARRVLGMVAQPGLDARAALRVELAVEPGGDRSSSTGVASSISDHPPQAARRCAAARCRRATARSAARARETRDITVPIGMRSASAHSA